MLLLISIDLLLTGDFELVTVLVIGNDVCGVLCPGFCSEFSKSDELLLSDGWRKGKGNIWRVSLYLQKIFFPRNNNSNLNLAL